MSGTRSTLGPMFLVSEADAAAVRAALHEGGELLAAAELRRRFPGLDSTAEARRFARTIAGWSVPEQSAVRNTRTPTKMNRSDHPTR